MTVEAMAVTDTEKKVISFHKILDGEVSVLVDFLFFLRGETCSVTEGEFGNDCLIV